jgi:hypothetical protein
MAMKTIERRLCRLEASLTPPENEEVRNLVALLRERRQRRLEASGEPFEVRPCGRFTDDQDRPLSVAEVLRMGRRRVSGHADYF